MVIDLVWDFDGTRKEVASERDNTDISASACTAHEENRNSDNETEAAASRVKDCNSR